MPRKRMSYSSKPSMRARAAHAKGEKAFKTYDTSAIRPEKKSATPFIIGFIIAIIILICVVAVSAFNTCTEKNDHMLAEGETVQVEIPQNSFSTEMAQYLFDAGVIESKTDFNARVSELGVGTKLKAGVYTFTGGMTLDEVIELLETGPSTSTGLTVAEGDTISSIATKVETAYDGKITADEFTTAAHNASAYVDDYAFVSAAYDNSLEGFLFPKTYELLTNADADDVVRQMLDQYKKETADLDYSYAESKGLSEYEVLILASIVEKESTSDTRAKVAMVFYNRLSDTAGETAGYLGSDATTAYEVGAEGLENYDWSTNSPYNTRVTKGLCPTPICSPSLETLQAVCSPDESVADCYYFSFWPNDAGEVEYFFDKTYADHQQTIADHS